MSNLRKFSIYHPIEGKVNDRCAHNYTYEYITSVEATNLVKSFYMAQDKFNPDYKALGKRNTTTGDLITVDSKLYMVNGVGGFKRIPSTKPLFQSVMELDEAIIEILSRRTLTYDDVQLLVDNCL
jgi:hypothetical protein